MIPTICEQKAMGALLIHPYGEYSIRGISKMIKTSYSLTYDSVQSLIKKHVIKAKKVGNTLVCKVNLSANPKALAIFSLIFSENFLKNSPSGYIIEELRSSLKEQLYIMILFGSYANETWTKDSDLDLLFVVQNESEIEKTRKKVRSVISSTKLVVDFDVITVEWLLKMFNENNTVGREVLEASIILHGAEQYYTLVNSYDKERGH